MPSHHPNKGKYRHYKNNGPVPRKFRSRGLQGEAPAPAALFETLDLSCEDPHAELALEGVYNVVQIDTAREILRGSITRIFSHEDEFRAPKAVDAQIPEAVFRGQEEVPHGTAEY